VFTAIPVHAGTCLEVPRKSQDHQSGYLVSGNFESLISGIRSKGATHWTAMFGQRLNVDEQFIDRKWATY
jgi:hypothetical protein